MLSPGPKDIWVAGPCSALCPPPFFSNSSSKCICSGLHFQRTPFSLENLINLCYYENDYRGLSVSLSLGNIFEFQKGLYGHHATILSPQIANDVTCFLLLHKMHTIHGILHEKLALIISIWLLLWLSPTSMLLNTENMCILPQNNTLWILLKCRFPWITSWRIGEMAVWAHRWNPITGTSMRQHTVLQYSDRILESNGLNSLRYLSNSKEVFFLSRSTIINLPSKGQTTAPVL